MAEALDILWFGRGDPAYSRNQILINAMRELGHRTRFFKPALSGLSYVESVLKRVPKPDVVWVPCFRQREVLAACKAAKRWGVPLVFDPLISAYDKQVFERRKFDEDTDAAKRLLAKERRQFAGADVVVADTPNHAAFFRRTLGVDEARLSVVPVGAQAQVFVPTPMRAVGERIQVLFYGSFIELQGAGVIVAAARHCPQVDFVLLGDGPSRVACEQAAQGLTNVKFEDPVPYESLPARIAGADVLLGVFSASRKAGDVVPNKVYQALASGRPVVTRQSDAYPPHLIGGLSEQTGLFWVPPEDPQALAECVRGLANNRGKLPEYGQRAAESYESSMGPVVVRRALSDCLAMVG